MRLLARRLTGCLQTKTFVRTVLPRVPKISASQCQLAQINTGTSKLLSPASAKSIRAAEPPAKISAFINVEKRRVVVETPNGTLEEYPWVWLRDNCQCKLCYEGLAQSRILNLAEFELDTRPLSAKIEDGTLHVEWDDGHQSLYDYDWLLERSFRPEQRLKFRKTLDSEQVLWGGEMQGRWPTADYNQIMTSDQGLLSWLEDLDKYGFVLIQNVPIEEGPVAALQARSGFARVSHYGPLYTVKIKPDPSNLSYTHHRIFFHADQAFYEHMPGAAYLHCIKQHQGPGGETMLADGFGAAEILRTTQPEKYKLLCNTVVYYKDVGEDYVKYNSHNQVNIFVHDIRGKLCRINWGHFQRDSFLDAEIDQVEEIYDAMRSFDDIINDPANHIKLKMQPGDMVTVMNKRMLHGRSELQGGQSSRHIQCGYMDWDEIVSTMRVLRASKASK